MASGFVQQVGPGSPTRYDLLEDWLEQESVLDTLYPALAQPTCPRRYCRFHPFLTRGAGFQVGGPPQSSLSANMARARLAGQMPRLVLPQHDLAMTHLGAMQPGLGWGRTPASEEGAARTQPVTVGTQPRCNRSMLCPIFNFISRLSYCQLGIKTPQRRFSCSRGGMSESYRI